MNSPRKLNLVSCFAFSLAFVSGVTATISPMALMAQDRGPVQRIVHGKVEDKAGAPIKGAIVYLQDSRTSSVKSAISDDDGSYRFVQLAQNTDYTLWAKLADKKSPNKSISSFDSKNDITIMLKIDK